MTPRPAKLSDGFCRRCDEKVQPFAIEYSYDSPEHYDGISEFQCPRCRRREGRWTGRVLTGGGTEPRLGEERDEVIAEEQYRHSTGTQPR